MPGLTAEQRRAYQVLAAADLLPAPVQAVRDIPQIKALRTAVQRDLRDLRDVVLPECGFVAGMGPVRIGGTVFTC